MPPKTEILVHVCAPSRASDDARYRKEARGYLQFEATARHALHDEQYIKGTHDGRSSFSEAIESSTTSSSSPDARHAKKRTLARALASTDELLRTPEVSRTGFHHAPIRGTPAINPWNKIHGKSPYIDIERTPAETRPRTAPTERTCIQETPHPRRSQSDSWETPPSVIPDSQPSIPQLKRPLLSSSPSPTRRSSSPSPKRRHYTSVKITSPTQNSSSPVPPEPQLDRAPFVLLPPTSSISTHTPLPRPTTTREIHGPRPPISSLPFKTHLTPSLDVIVNHLPLPTFFTPQQLRPPLRPLQALERGHWSFPISSIPTDTWGKFWTFLESFIQEGRASWGVWCVVEGDEKRVEEQQNNDEHKKLEGLERAEKRLENQGKEIGQKDGKSKEAPSPDAASPTFKLYCWGETAQEMWLVLFIGSHRRIKGCGAQWIDAWGEAVLQMK